jgi:hypothetical protein
MDTVGGIVVGHEGRHGVSSRGRLLEQRFEKKQNPRPKELSNRGRKRIDAEQAEAVVFTL